MANTRIRRKSIRNKKRRNNKKKSVRRQKKVGGTLETCANRDTSCKLNRNDQLIERVNALKTFVINTKCEKYTASTAIDANVKFDSIYETNTEISRVDLLKLIDNINEKHDTNTQGWSDDARKLVEKTYSTIKVGRNCSDNG